MTGIEFTKIICFRGTEEQIFNIEDFANQENIRCFSVSTINELINLSQRRDHSLFVFPEGTPQTKILNNLFTHGHAWWIWENNPDETELSLMENWVHTQHGADAFQVFCAQILSKVSGCLIPNFSPQIESTLEIDSSSYTHCVMCEAPSHPFTFKIEIFYNEDSLKEHPVFSVLPAGFLQDFFHEVENQFLGHLNRSVQHSPFEPDIGLPKLMGFDLDVIEAIRLQAHRILFDFPGCDIQAAVSVYSCVGKEDPNFVVEFAKRN